MNFWKLKQTSKSIYISNLSSKLEIGLDLTVNQTKLVLKAVGINLKGAPSKQMCYTELANAVAANEAEANQFLSISSLKNQQEEEQDDAEEYGKLIELLEDDTENRNDPNIKGEKKKLAQKTISKPRPTGDGDCTTLEPTKKKPKKMKGQRKGQRQRENSKGKNTSPR